MKTELAEYIIKLREAQQQTKRAEDRSLYEKYLAEAGILLAMVEIKSDKIELKEAISHHERLWDNTWLIDPVFKGPSKAWGEITRQYNVMK